MTGFDPTGGDPQGLAPVDLGAVRQHDALLVDGRLQATRHVLLPEAARGTSPGGRPPMMLGDAARAVGGDAGPWIRAGELNDTTGVCRMSWYLPTRVALGPDDRLALFVTVVGTLSPSAAFDRFRVKWAERLRLYDTVVVPCLDRRTRGASVVQVAEELGQLQLEGAHGFEVAEGLLLALAHSAWAGMGTIERDTCRDALRARGLW